MPVAPLVASRLADRDSNHPASADPPPRHIVSSLRMRTRFIHLEAFMSNLAIENQYQKIIKTFLFNNLINIPLTKPLQTPC